MLIISEQVLDGNLRKKSLLEGLGGLDVYYHFRVRLLALTIALIVFERRSLFYVGIKCPKDNTLSQNKGDRGTNDRKQC